MSRTDILDIKTSTRPRTLWRKGCRGQPATRSYRGWAAYAEMVDARADPKQLWAAQALNQGYGYLRTPCYLI